MMNGVPNFLKKEQEKNNYVIVLEEEKRSGTIVHQQLTSGCRKTKMPNVLS